MANTPFSQQIANGIAGEADILINIAKTIVPVERLVTGAAYLMGVFFAIKALQSLKHFGETRTAQTQHSSMKEPVLFLLIAAVFLYFPSAFSIFMNTTFGYSSVLAYSPIETSNQAMKTLFGSGSQAGEALSRIIQLIGLIAFIRGWLILAKSAQGQQHGSTGKAITHIFGGILAMNIVGTLQILNNTLYG